MISCISGFWLKVIAIITMSIDHVGAVLFPEEILFRVIGRIAFPIFCFLIVEGFFHTKDVKKYMIRLGIFALLSEIPFNLLVSGSIFDIKHQNVYFTLLIGLVVIYVINKSTNQLQSSVMLVAGMAISMVFMTDYSFYGVLLIYVFYIMYEKRAKACITMGIMSFVMSIIQGAATFSALPILMYNGKKGPAFANRKVWKYMFYVFYPVHMIVICVIAWKLGILR